MTDNKPSLQPLADRVVLQRGKAAETTSGGIVLPDSAKEKVNRGSVVAVGDGVTDDSGKRAPLKVKPGDDVLFSAFAGDEFTLGDDAFLLVRESDILAVLRE